MSDERLREAERRFRAEPCDETALAWVRERRRAGETIRTGCGHKVAAPHECPFAAEIHGDDTLCTCCEECAYQCAMDV